VSEQFTRGDVVSLLLEVMDWTYVKAHRETPMSEAEKKVLDEVRAALAEPKKERAETGIPAQGEIEVSTGEAYPTPQQDAKREPYTLAELFAQFAAKQRPLDADMAAIINANLDSLYITDEPAAALAEPTAKREPATHGEISEKFYNAGSDRYYRQADYRLGWRAAERHHGIGGSK
jgi:hypothetical protein